MITGECLCGKVRFEPSGLLSGNEVREKSCWALWREDLDRSDFVQAFRFCPEFGSEVGVRD